MVLPDLGRSDWYDRRAFRVELDHQQGHVHALSLPVSRTEYVLRKMGAGVVLVAIPAAALWVGCQLAAASVDLPAGLPAYPNMLALRFLLASLVSYAAFFAMASGTIKTTIWVSSIALAFFVFGGPFGDFLGLYFDVFDRTNIVEWALQMIMQSPGPAEIMTGNWTLFDV
jgi:hypothetical protein